MTNSNNDIEELEELLTELEGQEAQLVRPYSEEDDAVTQLMDAPLGDQEWMVQVTALDRRMMSTGQLLAELQGGKLSMRTLVWRGGMDDWMPISRIDELSRSSAPPVAPAPRYAVGNLPPPPAPPPSQASWASAPLAQPPMALTPPPPPPSPSKPYVAPLPPPPAPSVSQTNTTRPVAVDFSDMTAANDSPLQGKRWVMALSAVAILAVFVTVYSLSSGGDDGATQEAAALAQPQAVNALHPASAGSGDRQSEAAARAAEAKAEASPTTVARASEDESDSNAGSATGAARQTNAPARYAPRSDYRRRSRTTPSGGASAATDEAEETPAAAPSAPSTGSDEGDDSSGQVAATTADDDADADEAPKSSGKSGSTFNREAAKAALDEAASQAKNCRPQGGPSGTGRVQVRYEPSGKVAAVSILSSKFENTTAGSCVRMLFRRAKVPEFTGAPVVVVNKSFEIP